MEPKPDQAITCFMVEDPTPKYKWRKTWPAREDAASHETDFSGWDGDVCIGRIKREPHGLKKDKWHWSGQGLRARERLLPHVGYADTARQAAALVEHYYERLMAHNGGRL
ncbi:hypothetical protein [Rhizobium tubonense]|uniref:hypothetical protein n=1 Tax=Rhizobium tubonense TaxID=484088 RepID=UPI001FCE8CF7|nr:hypothetical protein [Rhizobium tubonense]